MQNLTNDSPSSSVYRQIESCAFCRGEKLHEVLDLGTMALAGGFLTQASFLTEAKFPLRVVFCERCYAVQVSDVVSANVLFHDSYYYFSSAIPSLRAHFQAYASEVTAKFQIGPQSKVLEIGCNDGVLLKPLAEAGAGFLVGVDPSKNVLDSIEDDRIQKIHGYFDTETSKNIVADYGHMDLIVANNVFAHIPAIGEVTACVARTLKPTGVFVFEVHYLGSVP